MKFYLTDSHPCSYLPDEEAVTLFVDPKHTIDIDTYTLLSVNGFRRSGSHIYKPHCGTCKACIPARIPVQDFRLNRRWKRIIKRNNDLDIHIVEHENLAEHYPLYARYIEQRHADGDMYPPSEKQYQEFLNTQWGCTRYIEFRQQDQLLAVAVVDQINDGLSAIYTYFDPDYCDRSLGSLAVLWQIQYCIDHDLPYVYLGYWVKNCAKMRYKTDYRPIELLADNRWLRAN